MITFEDLQQIVSEVKTVPYTIKVDKLVGSDKWYLQACLWREDVVTHEWGEGRGSKFYVSPYSTVSEIVQKCLAACLAYGEHEIRENFFWRGRKIFGPHFDVNHLWEAAGHEQDVRLDNRSDPSVYCG